MEYNWHKHNPKKYLKCMEDKEHISLIITWIK